jgi:hypothetical protein
VEEQLAAQLQVSPADIVINLGQSLHLQAVPRTAQGEPVGGYLVTWESSNPEIASVSAQGVVAAIEIGSTFVTATAKKDREKKGRDSAPGQLKKQVPVTVANPVSSVVIDPSAGEVQAGRTLQLTATLRDAGGETISDRTVTWSTSDASVAIVDETGLVTGVGEGVAETIASAEGMSGTAEVTVIPATRLVIFEDDFEMGDLSRWDAYDATKYSVTSNAARVKSGNFALETKMFTADDWGELNKWYMPGYDDVYVQFDVMFEEGFENLRADGNGMHFFAQMGNRIDNKWSASGKAGTRPDGTDFFISVLDPEHYCCGDPTLLPLAFYTYYPEMTCGDRCWGNFFTQDPPKLDLMQGTWHEIVFHVKMNTPGSHDGLQELWIDGQKKIEVSGMRWRDTIDLRLNQVSFWTYMPGAPKTQHIWIDNFVVWGPGTP